MEPTPSTALVILVRDLLLGSKIFAAAKASGLAHVAVRDPARLPGIQGRRLIVDLNLDGAIPAAAAWRNAETGRSVIGFVAHVDAETVRQARDQGIERVVARGTFFQSLPEMLGEPELSPDDEDLSE